MTAKRVILLLSTCTLLAGLSAVAYVRLNPGELSRAQPPRTFQVQGKLLAIHPGEIRVAHEAIPGYMPAMTMSLPVHDPKVLTKLRAGDLISFELHVTNDDSWVARISRLGSESGAEANTTRDESSEADLSRLQLGEVLPDFNLIDQNRQPVSLSQFRGKAVLLTFIYTRCPLPNFCPLMSKNFSALQARLAKQFPGRFHLLSLTIDPEFDQPEILKSYAIRYAAQEESWTFATGSREQIDAVASLMGLTHEPENGLISHDLRTALISPEGRLVQLWKSNVWTAYEVERQVREVLAVGRQWTKR